MFYLAQQINPDCPICFYNIGNSLFSRQQYKRAIWCWEQTAMLEPTHPQINYRTAQALWADGNIEAARQHFLEELRNNPGDTDIILDFGMFLLECGDIEGAKEKFNRIIELNPESASAVFYLGEVMLNKSDTHHAKELFMLALELNPNFTGARYRLGQIALAEDDPDRTLQYLQVECELGPEDTDVLFSMGLIFLQLNDFDYATNCFLRIVDEDAENAEAFYYLGTALAMQREYEGALQFLEHAVSLGYDNAEALADTAYVYSRTGRPSLAAETIAEARSVSPDNRKVASVYRKLKITAFVRHIKKHFFIDQLFQKIRLLPARYKCRLMRFLKAGR